MLPKESNAMPRGESNCPLAVPVEPNVERKVDMVAPSNGLNFCTL